MIKTQIKVLLIEDNPVDVLLLSEALRRDALVQFNLTSVERLDAAFEALQTNTFDVIIFDLNLPDSKGLETFTRIHEKTPVVPKLILSGNADEGLAVLAVQAGAQDYLVKSAVGYSSVLRAIRYAIERENAQAILYANEQRLHLAATAGEVGIWDWDVIKDELIWDDSMYSLYGTHKDDFNGAYEAWSITLHPDDREFVDAEIQAALRGEREYTPEFRIIRPDGRVRLIKATSHTLHNHEGKAVRMLGTNIDITERKLTETKLSQSEKRFATIFENSPTAIGISRISDNKLIEVNSAFLELYGYERKEVIEHTTSEMGIWAKPEDRQQLIETLKKEGFLQNFEATFRNKTGGEIAMLLAAEIIEINNEPCLVILSTDITKLKEDKEALRESEEKYRNLTHELERRVQEQTAEVRESRDELSAANAALEKALRLKDDFLASMSHELRTPLTGILGLSEALRLKTYGEMNEKQAHAVKMVEDSGRHLLELINDILDLSKIEAGQLELQFDSFFIGDVCQSSIQLIKGMMQQKKQRLNYVPPAEPIMIRTDARRLKQILVNLLSNAIKFTPNGGEFGLDVQVNVLAENVKLVVWDKGIGIQSEQIHKLFKPFMQIDSSLAREYAGTGLGLSLVQRLVELHNGSVEVQSVFGEGSRFTITLPWSPQNIVSMPQASAQRVAKGTAPLSTLDRSNFPLVLTADDNEMVLEVVADYLQAKQYRVIKIRSGMELLEKAAEFHPDIMLVDIQMPGMNGLETIQRIRAHADTAIAATPIIAITALAMSGDRERCLAAGANVYMSKPVKLQELAKMIQQQIGQKQ